jgi:hypothetical protein
MRRSDIRSAYRGMCSGEWELKSPAEDVGVDERGSARELSTLLFHFLIDVCYGARTAGKYRSSHGMYLHHQQPACPASNLHPSFSKRMTCVLSGDQYTELTLVSAKHH